MRILTHYGGPPPLRRLMNTGYQQDESQRHGHRQIGRSRSDRQIYEPHNGDHLVASHLKTEGRYPLTIVLGQGQQHERFAGIDLRTLPPEAFVSDGSMGQQQHIPADATTSGIGRCSTTRIVNGGSTHTHARHGHPGPCMKGMPTQMIQHHGPTQELCV